MKSDRFHDLCRKSSRLAVADRTRIGNLVLTQARGHEPTIREPEMLHAFCRILDSEGQAYGIEVPTDGRFRFAQTPGERRVKARHDLVLFDDRTPDVLVELKREQPAGKGDDYPAISKDLRKLLREGGAGKAMIHICHASDRGTLPAVISKYNAALTFARNGIEIDGLRVNDSGWFSLFILVLYDRNQGDQPVLHRCHADSLADLFQHSPAFGPGCFRSEMLGWG